MSIRTIKSLFFISLHVFMLRVHAEVPGWVELTLSGKYKNIETNGRKMLFRAVESTCMQSNAFIQNNITTLFNGHKYSYSIVLKYKTNRICGLVYEIDLSRKFEEKRVSKKRYLENLLKIYCVAADYYKFNYNSNHKRTIIPNCISRLFNHTIKSRRILANHYIKQSQYNICSLRVKMLTKRYRLKNTKPSYNDFYKEALTIDGCTF